MWAGNGGADGRNIEVGGESGDSGWATREVSIGAPLQWLGGARSGAKQASPYHSTAQPPFPYPPTPHPPTPHPQDLSGGELQRFAIAIVLVQKADVYMFDEPSSYLDVMQRLKAAKAIRSLLSITV